MLREEHKFVVINILLLFHLVFILLFIMYFCSFGGQIMDPLLVLVHHFWESCIFKMQVFDYDKQCSVPQRINFWWLCWKQSFLENYLSAVDLVTNYGHKSSWFVNKVRISFYCQLFPKESIPLVCILFSTYSNAHLTELNFRFCRSTWF